MPIVETFDRPGPCPYPSRVRSICKMLDSRARGYVQRKDMGDFLATATSIADRELVDRHSVSDIKEIEPEMRSCFVVKSGERFVYTAHTNRCVSIVSLRKMVKVADITDVPRTVWTIDLHPLDERYLAIGTLNGCVSVYKNHKLFNSFGLEHDREHKVKVCSIAFQPSSMSIACYAIQFRIMVWDYSQNALIHMLSTEREGIKYLRFHPTYAMLITGISYEYTDYFTGENLCYAETDNYYKGPATALLFKIFHVIECILRYFEQAFTGQFGRMTAANRPWADLLQTIRNWKPSNGLKLHQNCEPTNLDDFYLTLTLFDTRTRNIQNTVPDFMAKKNSVRQSMDWNIDIDLLTKLRQITVDFREETKHLNNSHGVDHVHLEKIIVSINTFILMQLSTLPTQIPYPEASYQRIQIWPFDGHTNFPDLQQKWRNFITQAAIHNDSAVEVTNCGKLMASFRRLAYGEYEITVHSLDLPTIGDRIFAYNYSHNTSVLSLSISPSREYLLVGLRSTQTCSYFLRITGPKWLQSSFNDHCDPCSLIGYEGRKQNEDVSVVRWMKRPGDGAIAGFCSHHLRTIGYAKRSFSYKQTSRLNLLPKTK